MKGKYEVIDHTADIAIRTTGNSMEEAFGNAAYAMFDTMCDITTVKPQTVKKVECQAEDIEQLLVDWLSELLFLCDVDDMVFSEFEVKLSGTNLAARVKGERIDPDKHHLKTDIKAITYHMLKVDQASNTVQVLFDI